jgi:hypothetical protein
VVLASVAGVAGFLGVGILGAKGAVIGALIGAVVGAVAGWKVAGI